ncbi:hypothetical protein ROP_37920 [Rhodococcus opacus B4]|uniref:Uncharacterized protein n=1 Tax=Rhodococcus opacus (strain B4) TaxID=632772 RepID=C1B8N6_RHOOB|nr:hypothetical protein [Rhodococcus opacus]BAH52039.1 hypothetical protein ROP_37920 [Rhodococcus opacus B4]
MGIGEDIQGALSDEIQKLEALRVKLVVDYRCTVDVLGFPNVKMWPASRTLLEVGAAGRIVMLGRGLRRQPEIADEFYDTNISPEHAHPIWVTSCCSAVFITVCSTTVTGRS